jgi:hypothetical protein
MNTDDLILRLSHDVPPVARHAARWRLLAGLGLGTLVALAVVLFVLGVRSDLHVAMHGFSFWMKWGYAASLSVVALGVTARLARPDTGRLGLAWILVVPVGLLAMAAIVELIRTPPAEWLAMWLGKSWMVCPWIVLGLAMPIFIGLLWSFRRLAPTRLRAAGAAAGLSAGAFAATVYCVHCPEVSAIFVLTWYSLGILLAASLGALVGPRLLRW